MTSALPDTRAPVHRARIVADFGGTNARFALVGASRHDLDRIEVLACADYPRVEDAIAAYIREQRIASVEEVCIAAAGPVEQDVVDLPNNHWVINRL